jgi:hypothetical protein
MTVGSIPKPNGGHEPRRISRNRRFSGVPAKGRFDEQTISTFFEKFFSCPDFVMYILLSGEAEAGSAEVQPAKE